MCALHRYRHKPSCRMGKEQGKDKFLALLGAGECDTSANKQAGDTGVRGGLRFHAWGTSRSVMAAVWRFESSELAANPLPHSLPCGRRSHDSREKYIV